jgi:pimeloyl-ACP methyl ester carboxylesterase
MKSNCSLSDYECDYYMRRDAIIRGLLQTLHLLFVYLHSFLSLLTLTFVTILSSYPQVLTDPFACLMSFVVIPLCNSALLGVCSMFAVVRFWVHYVFWSGDHRGCLSTVNLFQASSLSCIALTDVSGGQMLGGRAANQDPFGFARSPSALQESSENDATASAGSLYDSCGQLYFSEGQDPQLEALGTHDQPGEFDWRVGKLLLTLSTLVYECECVNVQSFVLRVQRILDLGVLPVELETTPRRTAFIFFSDQLNVIILCFKGTNPLNFHEMFIDGSIHKVDARAYVFGGVHQGFYRSLFQVRHLRKPRITQTRKGSVSNGEEVLTHTIPYQVIMEGIQLVVHRLSHRHATKPGLWVTGHSLGGALATLFYARHLKSNELDALVHVKGVYTFGSPRVGNFDFAQEFESLTNLRPPHQRVQLWRIVFANDIVPRLPFGKDSLRFSLVGGGNGQSALDYVHVGNALYLHRRGGVSVYRTGHAITFSVTEMSRYLYGVVDDYLSSWLALKDLPTLLSRERDDVKLLCALLPVGLFDHTTNAYLRAINRHHTDLSPSNEKLTPPSWIRRISNVLNEAAEAM